MKKIIALSGVIILVLLYVATLVSAITTSPQTPELFKACVAATIILPVFMYAYVLIYRLQKKKIEENSFRFQNPSDNDEASDKTDKGVSVVNSTEETN